MSVKVTSSLFYDRFTGTGGGGCKFYPGNILDQIGHVLYFYVSWNIETTRAQFDAATKTISLTNSIDSRTFTNSGFIDTDAITIVGTASNDGDYTINAISEDGRTATVVETLVDEDSYNTSIHGITPITDIDFQYNLIKNGANENYFSLTDTQTRQRFIASGLDATVTTAIPMVVGSKSFAWVSNIITGTAEGSTTECTIKGDGITDYKQQFIITQSIKFTTPIFLNGLFPNFQTMLAPELYNNLGLKYICALGMKFEDSAVINHTGGITSQDGKNSWLNVGPDGERAEYYVDSITYENSDTADSMERLDVNKNVLVTMVFKSRSSRFEDVGVGPGSKVTVGFNTCPSAEVDYQNTETTLIENYFIDSATSTIGAASINGTNFGTGYQSITDFEIAYNSTSQVTITFVFSAGSTLKEYWESKSDDDRFYLLSLITQGIDFTTTAKTDRATISADWQSADWDKEDSTLSGFTGTGIEMFEFPDTGSTPIGSAKGFEGDPFIAKIGFWVDNQQDADGNTPTLKQCSFQIIASKTGQDDFVIEEKIISTGAFPKVLNVQKISVEEERGFVFADDSPFNSVFIVRDSDNDLVNKPAYLAHYAFALRFEFWIDALAQFQMITGGAPSAISKYIADINQRWTNYNNIEGWNLFFRFSWTVTGTDGFDNQYFTEVPIETNEVEQTIWPGGTGPFTEAMQYFAWDTIEEEIIEEINASDIDGITLVKATFTGDFALPTDANFWHGMLFINSESESVYERRIASSAIESEVDSPWSAPPEDPDATYSLSSGNARINVYMSATVPPVVEQIIVESLLNTEIYDALVLQNNIYARIGPVYNSSSSGS